MLDCFRKTWAREGLGGLYAGAMSPLLGAMAHNAGVFFSYGLAKKVRIKFCVHSPEIALVSSPLVVGSQHETHLHACLRSVRCRWSPDIDLGFELFSLAKHDVDDALPAEM